MTKRELPSPDLLRKLLRYDAETGKLFWLPRPREMFAGTGPGGQDGEAKRWNARLAGKPTFNAVVTKGYLQGTAIGRHMMSHRVAWAIYYGDWPSDEIDHINGIKTDNRIANLRVVSTVGNSQNRPIRIDNSSGCQGVSWHKAHGKWRASICVDKRMVSLGYFHEKHLAIDARKAAEILYGFHVNHGRPNQSQQAVASRYSCAT